MRVLNLIKRFLLNPEIRMGYFSKLGLYNKLSDEDYINKRFKTIMKYNLDLNNVNTFNEKLQWLKLYDRKTIYTTMVDKYLVKEYVSKNIGEEYVIPTLAHWENEKMIDFESLPEQFVLKCNHNSGTGMFICKSKEMINEKRVRAQLKRGLKENYYLKEREWPYKNVKKVIIAEKYMGSDLCDYKIQCFNGVADNILVCYGRESKEGVKYYYFNKNWEYLPYSKQIDESFHDYKLLKPQNLDLMISLAEKLASNVPQIRVDFYEINGRVYFGELTFFTQGGFDTTITREADEIMGQKLVLEDK